VRCRRDALPLIQTGANVHDSEQSITLIDAIPPIQRLGGGRRRRPDQAFANRVYDAEPKIGYPCDNTISSGLGQHLSSWKASSPDSSNNVDCQAALKNVTISTRPSSSSAAC